MLQSFAPVTTIGKHQYGGRQPVSPVAKGCEPGQVRKEAAVASESGAGVGQAGAVSIVSDQNLATRNRLNRIITPALLS